MKAGSIHRIAFWFLIVIGVTTGSVFSLTPSPDYLPESFENRVFTPEILTVLLRSDQWELSLPVIELNGEQKLELRFDELSMDRRSFGYTIIHCDAEWRRSALSPQDYLTGFGQGTIREVSGSFNTTYDYTHYRLVFPEADCMPVLSGNYALVVYNEEYPDKIILTQKFYVTEKTAQIDATVQQPDYGSLRETEQQVMFTVQHDGSDIRDPLHEVVTVILQNNRSYNGLAMTKPFSIQEGRLEYNDPDRGIFMGGNEFRSLDIKSLKYQTENVAGIEFQIPYYHVFMKPDGSRGNKPYFSKTDLNGSYFIDREKSDNKHIEADYVFVHFNLSLPPLYAGENVYVTGGFNNWIAQEKNKMVYNNEKGCFELTVLLKQGLYDYCFVKEDPGNGLINEYELEGSFFETENDYSIFVYFHDRLGYDRLLGYLPIK
jgi:hypothetical protein